MNFIFLSYINRSGSTFLANQLSKHQNIIACPEAEILANILLLHPQEFSKNTRKSLIKLLQNDYKLRLWNLPEDVYNFPSSIKTRFEVFKYLLLSFKNKYQPNAEYILYKAERMFQLFPIISKIKEKKDNIHFIFLVRDIRAIFSSQVNTIIPGTNKLFTNCPLETSLYWNKFINSIPDKSSESITVQYENLILDFKNEIERILISLNIENSVFEKKGSLSKFMPQNYQHIHKNIDKVPQVNRVESWKKTLRKKDLILIELASAKYLAKFNYSLINKYHRYHYLNFNFMIQFLKVSTINIIKKIIYKINVNKIIKLTLILI